MTRLGRPTLLAAFVLAAACGGPEKSGPSTPGAVAPHPERIEDLAKEVQSVRAAGDEKKLLALVAPMIPTHADLVALVDAKRPGAHAFLDGWQVVDLPAGDPRVAALAAAIFGPGDPGRTETRAHAATTKEILAYEKGGTAYAEFPGGMRRFAAILAEPDRTWWVVEHVKPGEDMGMKFSAFTRTADGRWLFFPKPWRSVPGSGD